jgi:hypothetical protein
VEDEELYVKMYKTRDLKHMVRKWIHPERYFHYMRENQTRKRSDLPPIDMSWLNKHVMREAYVNREIWYEGKGMAYTPRPRKPDAAEDDGKRRKRLLTKTPPQDLVSPTETAMYATQKEQQGKANCGSGKIIVTVAKRQSGVPGVSWIEQGQRWRATWMENGKQINIHFPVQKYISEGVDYEQAVEKCREAAVALRKAKVASGTIKVLNTASRTSGIRGVRWNVRSKGWVVAVRKDLGMRTAGCKGGKRISKQVAPVTTVRPKDLSEEEIEKAFLLAVQKKAEIERKHYIIKMSGSSSSKK